MKHASLFSGEGGFDLAAEWMGWENRFHCEINDFCKKILKFYWPNAISHGNIKETDFTIYRGLINVLSGGFPCQPYSLAGARKGKEDERHLWPEFFRAIKEIQPDWVVGENVRGIVNWNGGLVFDEVQADLESAGYEVQPFILPASGVGADHIRERVWFVAHAGSLGWKDVQDNFRGSNDQAEHTERFGSGRKWRFEETNVLDSSSNTFLRFQEMHGQPAIFDVDDGLPFELDGITISKWFEESLRASGNAIAPQVAYRIFKAIELFINNQRHNPHRNSNNTNF